MIEEAVRRWNPWWAEKKIPDQILGIHRDITDSIIKTLKTPHIKDIIGVRRSGKTTVLYQTADYLIKTGTDPKNIIFINFDDPTINAASFDEILKEIYKINPEISHIFLDEIQQKKGFENWIRMLYDTKKFSQIFLSGSSASLLSQETGMVLSGRHITSEVFPLSFPEYLKISGLKGLDQDYLLNNRERLLYHLTKYLKEGGFPESAGTEDYIHKMIITSLYNDIIARDIASRFGADYNITKRISHFMLTNTTSEYSYSRISKNTDVTVETAEKYTGYLLDSLMILQLPLFSYKLKVQYKQNKKIYATDTGLRNEVSFSFSSDIGKLAENAVYIELKRRGHDIYYWKDKDGFEADFLIKEGMDISKIIQVCWDPKNDKTKSREERSIVKACTEFNLKSGLILTEDYQDTTEADGIKIEYYPLWKWFCGI